MGTKLLFFVSLLLATEVMAQGQSVVLIEQISIPPKVPNAHERILSTLKEVAQSHGWNLTVQKVDGEACKPLSKCARLAGEDYVLTLSGTTSKDFSYDLSIELLSTKTGNTQTATSYCDFCEFDRMTQNLSKSVGELLERNGAEDVKSKDEPKLVQVSPPTQPVQIKSETRIGDTLSLVSIGFGAGFLGYGVWALAKDGDLKSCTAKVGTKQCEYYKTEVQGIAVGSIGMVMILGGVAWQVFGGDSNATVSLSPRHVAFTTRF